MKSLFDNDYIKINDLAFKYGITSIIILIFFIISIVYLQKSHFYQNAIKFIEKNRGVLLVEKQYINDVKEKNELLLNDISMKYDIEKIEKQDNMYYVYIKFAFEIERIDVNTYKILLDRESVIKYIVRIIKGG